MHCTTSRIPFTLFIIISVIIFVPITTISSLRTHLGEISVDLTGDGKEERVLKVRIQNDNESKIIIEIYKDEKLISQVLLPNARDANFSFKDKRSNLLAADINGDGVKDILTVSRDKDNNSVLSVVSYKNGAFTTNL